ncbi:MAG: hypothetical protein ACU84J_14155 [Gammaproteobacteria bacterium]
MINPKHIAIVVLYALLSACANFDAVDRFAEGARMLAVASGEFYQIELQTDRKLAGFTVNLEEPDQPGKSSWLEATTGANLMAEAERNKAAVAALAEYANGLQDIANFDNDEAVQKSAQKLSGNLGDLARTLNSDVADTDDSALAKAIVGLADIYTDLKVKKILRQKVEQAQPHVALIVNTLVADIKRQQQRAEMTQLLASTRREQWFASLKEDVLSGQMSESHKALAAIAAKDLIEAELADKLAELPARGFLLQLKSTAAGCLAAHEAIRKADLKDDAKELVTFVNESRQLLDGVMSLR